MIEKMRKLKYYKTHILVVLSFLLGCMLTINLTPINKTCQIDDTDREYNIMKNSKLKNPELIVLILSAPKNLDRRNIIRQTWLKLLDKDEVGADDDNTRFKMKHYFVVGSLNLNMDQVLHLTSEQSEFNDILILPIHDSYQNLTRKVLKSFEWLNEQFDYGLGFKYVLKCDDDTFVRLDKLALEIINVEQRYLNSELNEQHLDANRPFVRLNVQINKYEEKSDLQLYWGYFSGSARIKTAGKWKENDWIACDNYIPYALGGGYVLSRKLINFIARNSDSLKLFNSEDVSIGFWLSPVNNILRIHDIRFDTEWITRGCQNFYLITHNISNKKMLIMYSNILSSDNMCVEQALVRHHYFYNWSAPPSQCCTKNLQI